MNPTLVDQIVNAVLYEGCVLYPYRPSVKNRQRWTFGGLYPDAWCQAHPGSDASANQTECLLRGGPGTALTVTVRFLHLTERRVGRFDPPLDGWPVDQPPPYQPVESLDVEGRVCHAWQEAEERRLDLAGLSLEQLLRGPCRREVVFGGRTWREPLRQGDGRVPGVLDRCQQTVTGSVEVAAAPAAPDLPDVFRLTVRVANRTALDGAAPGRDAALLRSLVSTHVILGVREGAFVSLVDPPDSCRAAAAACKNVGTWPVLVGEPGDTDTVLSSPIILYDYPQVAPESPGDLFDGSEIDEILTLRILTLTDEEKRAAAGLDGRVRDLLARTEALARGELARLHGAWRQGAHPGGDA